MKKILLTGLIGSVVAINAMAAGGNFHLSAGSMKIGDDTGSLVSIGYEGDNLKTTNGFYWGFGMDFGVGRANSVNTYNLSANLKLGYSPIKNLAVYGMVVPMIQSYDNNSAYGFGFGGGADYKISKHFDVSLEYTKYNMSIDSNGYYGGDYDMNIAALSIGYRF